MSMVSSVSVFHCTLIINPARLFHNFQNVEWFVITMQNVFQLRSTTILNNLHLQREMCFWLRWKIYTVVEWFGRFNETFFWNITRTIASEFSLPWKSQLWVLSHEKTPLVEIPPVIIALQQTKKQTIFKT